MTGAESETSEQKGELPDLDGGEESETTGDQPEMTGDEMADFGDVADSIVSDGPAETETSEEKGEQPDSDDSENSGETGDESPVGMGRLYCNALGMSAAVARGRFGEVDGDRDELADEYAAVARQIELDEFIDEWMETSGGLESLSPGQAVVLGTLLWGGMVLIDDPEMAAGLAEHAEGAL